MVTNIFIKLDPDQLNTMYGKHFEIPNPAESDETVIGVAFWNFQPSHGPVLIKFQSAIIRILGQIANSLLPHD